MKREHFKTSLKDCNVNTNQVWLNVVVVHRIWQLGNIFLCLIPSH